MSRERRGDLGAEAGPVPADRGVQPSSTYKFVLVGLASHAGRDGTGAFPSMATLVRYTGLSERTARTCLDWREAGVIRPCDRDVVAARIKRADRRPKGWDLDPSLIRDELTEATLRHWCISSLACAPRSRACHSLPRCFSRPDGRRPVPRLAARVAHGFTAAVRCPMLRCRRDHGGDDWDPAETGSHSARSSLRAAAAKALRSGTASRSATTVMLSCPA